MPLMIIDPREIAEIKKTWGSEDRFEEVWNGVTVMPPIPNDEHQDIQLALGARLYVAVQDAGLGLVRNGVNVSDRDAGWLHNYRGPDVVVFTTDTEAINHGAHWEGGPDFLVEIISPGEDPQAKFTFYAAVGTREVLIVDRYPWAVELFQLRAGRLVSAGRSDLANPARLASGVLPLSFRLVPGPARPRIELTHADGRTWVA